MSRQTLNSDVPSRTLGGDAKPKKNKGLKVFGVIAAVIISILMVIAVTLIVLLYIGEKSATGVNRDAAGGIVVPAETRASVDSDQDSGVYIYYNDKKYQYNDKVTTIMFAGVDKHSDEYDGLFAGAGQADCIIIAALNTETGKYKLMALSRDTMTDINTYDTNGNFIGTEKFQICLAHAYGDGKEQSCENLKTAVSRVMFGLPINSYAVIDLDAIPILNDAVGGVNVTVNEDLTHKDPNFWEGAQICLQGDQAELFVRTRDTAGDENQNNLRMERQKSFIEGFVKQTLAMTKENIKTPINIYNDIKPYMVTDIDVPTITYYTGVFLKSGFESDENFIKIPGTTTHGDQYAEYYVDNEALFDIVLDTYYTEVK